VLSCALLSREAAPSIASIHHRMPVLLHAADQAVWLAAETSPGDVQELIAGSRTDFEARRVSTRVNSVRNEAQDLIDQI
jgi:putative SOS response-associated peptidase YedK